MTAARASEILKPAIALTVALYDYVEFDSSIALAMLKEGLKNQHILSVLHEIAAKIRKNIFLKITETNKQLSVDIFQGLAMQHSKGDRFGGALLPNHTQEYLGKTTEGRKILLEAIDKCLCKTEKIETVDELLSLMKVIDGMGYAYDILEAEKRSHKDQICFNYITLTEEEKKIRSLREEQLTANSYGIGTKRNFDLIPKNISSSGFFSGKARFYISSGRKPTPFEKLADQHKLNRPSLPLIAGPSSSTARSFMMANGISLFVKKEGFFDLDKAQIFANCLMGYFVYCGHHSFLEVMEIWNRFLDYLILERSGEVKCNNKERPEETLPYGRIGGYGHFLHHSYRESVHGCAIEQIKNKLDLRFDYSNIKKI